MVRHQRKSRLANSEFAGGFFVIFIIDLYGIFILLFDHAAVVDELAFHPDGHRYVIERFDE
jgi:hypothetical protein